MTEPPATPIRTSTGTDRSPLVSIVIPVFNDAAVIANALDSCTRQTLSEIEIIVVDDASTDDTVAIVRERAAADGRIRLITHETNRSAFQSRRDGVRAATAAHLMFLDGDDELVADAAAVALGHARETGAELVQFGIDVVRPDGTTGGRFENRLQPRLRDARGADVLRGLFPIGELAQGQLWRFLYSTRLLVDAYAAAPADLVLPRVNDLPIAFLAAALAQSHSSLPNHLYRYYFGRGGSGQRVTDLDSARFYAGAISSIDSIAAAVETVASGSAHAQLIRDTYESVRSSLIGYTTHYLADHTLDALRDEVFAHLYTLVDPAEVVHATARHWPDALETLAAHSGRTELGTREIQRVALSTNALRTGGVSGVILSQARTLLEAGVGVTIVAREPGSDTSLLPTGARFVEFSGAKLADHLEQWSDLCRSHRIDVAVDHHFLYSKTWPAFALAAHANGVPTIAWAHNFAGRAVLLGIDNLRFHLRHVHSLAHLVVLSPLDVAFWKLQGMQRVSYLPNPPSPLLLDTPARMRAKEAPTDRRLELVWFGRLDERTKRVSELLRVAADLDTRGVDFRMRIVGPGWRDLAPQTVNAQAAEMGLADRVQATGPLKGAELVRVIDSSDVLVCTSIIEGYPLTIPEAQSRGLPVAMYDLPWLAVLDDNEGIVSVEQGDAAALAAEIAAIATTPERYASLSGGSLAAADRERGRDYAALYAQLFEDRLPRMFSPEPSVGDAESLLDLMIHFAEDNARRQRALVAARADTTSKPPQEKRGGAADLVARVTPFAHSILDVAPWLRPTAARVKHALLRR